MTKYYVTSGDLRVVIAGPHISCPKEAAKETCLSHSAKKTLSNFIRVSEKGFDKHDDDVIMDTERLLIEAGFKIEGDENEDL